MTENSKQAYDNLPPITQNLHGKMRSIGVEIEFAGLPPFEIAKCITQSFGGKFVSLNPFKAEVTGGELGTFKIELDTSHLKNLGEKISADEAARDLNPLETLSIGLLTKAAEQFVPWEVVTSPIPINRYDELNVLIDALRKAGALGTRHTVRYAFGVHLNPEVTGVDAESLLNFFRAYLCLYDWISAREQIDLTRKLTYFIKHFDTEYIKKVVHPGYSPSQSEFIEDYLIANPSRNRSLDLLPLFSFIDEAKVTKHIIDDRIQARPTFHYRLPNCDIDNPAWNLSKTWEHWLMVEKLANQSQHLSILCAQYYQELSRVSRVLDNKWLNICEEAVAKL